MAAAPIIWFTTRSEPAGQTVETVGASAAAALASTSSAPPSTATEATTPTTSSPADVSADPIPESIAESPPVDSTPADSTVEESASSDDPEPAAADEPIAAPAPTILGPVSTPSRVIIPDLGVDAPVVTVGIDSKGAMEIPKDVSTVGWYGYGPLPGSTTGSAVLTGHVDDVSQGAGVFKQIGNLGPGDVFAIGDDAGSIREFKVIAREEWSKDQVPLDRLFDRGGEPRVVLITCGGTFDANILGYDDNIAVTAVPVDG